MFRTPYRFPVLIALALLLTGMLSLSACGNKGPLTHKPESTAASR